MAGLINISSPYLNNPSITFEGVVDGSKSGLDLKRDIWIVVNGMIPSIPFSVDDIEIQPLTGGITNVLYLVTFASMTLKIIVRLFGAGTSDFINRNSENRVLAHMSKSNLGPTFYGLFSNGRIEGYIESETLAVSDMGLPSIATAVAKACYRLHNQCIRDFPGKIFGWSKISEFIDLAVHVSFPENAPRQQLLDTIRDMKMESELEWLQTHLNTHYHTLCGVERERDLFSIGGKFGFQTVFAHNDLLSGNILVTSRGGTSKPAGSGNASEAEEVCEVVIIDFEYAGYNALAWDIANHFCEFVGFDFSKMFEGGFPSREVREHFYRAYLQAAATHDKQKRQKGRENEREKEQETERVDMSSDTTGSSASTITDTKINTSTDTDIGLGPEAAPMDEILGLTEWDREAVSALAEGALGPEDEAALLRGLDDVVCRFTLASHLFWGTWAVLQAAHSSIDFDFLVYAKLRFDCYLYHKRLFIQ